VKLLLGALFLMLSCATLALGGNPNVRFDPSPGAFSLVEANIWVDEGDWPGVRRAAEDLRTDIASVASSTLKRGRGKRTIIVGTLGRSPAIDRLVAEGKLSVKEVAGQWEASVTATVHNPIPGVEEALVVAGADKRGTIYALYDLSESIGVSPWSWWADVPVKHHQEIYIRPGRVVAKSPAVKYRGVFLNDEAPSLTNWVRANFGDYNHRFYERVFELLLRLRANYLWPAMWNNCFSQDDPLNPAKADEYGIVMGTSHVEPMMRADKEWNRLGFGEKEWNYATHPKELEKFWTDGAVRNRPYENVVTIAMRGKIDTPMSESANIELLEQIVTAQRSILAANVNSDLTQVPQMWCLYKEVQEYYEKGMRVPDDVTLLWSDDNWGDIRRLPTPVERKRSGRAGVYYHFDYVGGPRNYKWIDTNPLPKIWEQMNLAHAYGADRVWIVNAGDLKPMELPIEFFLTMARDPAAIPKEKISDFTRRWAAREFGPAHATEIAHIINETHRLAGRRKPELVDASTYSVLNYNEADRVLAEFSDLRTRAARVSGQFAADYQSAFFQLVQHPVEANGNLTAMYVAAAKNALYAKQGRAMTNAKADEVAQRFAQDSEITRKYHEINGGKWNHFMDQTHIGYTYWQQPDRDVMPKVTRLTVPNEPSFGVAVEGSELAWPGSADRREARLEFDRYGASEKSFEIFNRGSMPFEWSARCDAPWVQLSSTGGQITDVKKIRVSIRWDQAPKTAEAQIVLHAMGKTEILTVNADSAPGDGHGFIEGDGVIAFEAEHSGHRSNGGGVKWETVPGYGRTLSGVAPFPVTFDSLEPGHGPMMEYPIVVRHGGKATLHAICAPSLGFVPGRGLRLALAFDNDQPQVVDIAPSYLSKTWEKAVSDACVDIETKHTLSPGPHSLKVWAIDPGVVIQRFVIDLGGLRPSYLGPPESKHLP